MFSIKLHISVWPRSGEEVETVLEGEVMSPCLPNGKDSLELPGVENHIDIIGIWHVAEVIDGKVVMTPTVYCEPLCSNYDQWVVVVQALAKLGFTPCDGLNDFQKAISLPPLML